MKKHLTLTILSLAAPAAIAQTNLPPQATIAVSALLSRGQVLLPLPNRQILDNGDILEPFGVYEERVFSVYLNGETILATNRKSLGRNVTNRIIAPKHPDPIFTPK